MASSEINPTPRLKVLVADDDTPTRILLRAAIGQWGYEVIEACDGEEAWTILQQESPPRLLILDWLMPRLSGIGLCERIKKESIYHPYTILLTQVAGTENIVKGLEAGADEFLSKPFNMAELRSRLSVGARIISYENQIAQKNNEMEKCVLEMNEVALTRRGDMYEQQKDLLLALCHLSKSIAEHLSPELLTTQNELLNCAIHWDAELNQLKIVSTSLIPQKNLGFFDEEFSKEILTQFGGTYRCEINSADQAQLIIQLPLKTA